MQWIDDFEKSLLSLDRSISEFSKEKPSMQEACESLVLLNRLKVDFVIVYDQLAKIVSEAMGDIPEIILSDGSKVEKRSAADRKSWMHTELAHEVARRIQDIAVDLDTGERVMSVEDMIVKVFDYVQPSYWRVKALGEIGVSADKFCEVGESKESIIVRKAK